MGAKSWTQKIRSIIQQCIFLLLFKSTVVNGSSIWFKYMVQVSQHVYECFSHCVTAHLTYTLTRAPTRAHLHAHNRICLADARTAARAHAGRVQSHRGHQVRCGRETRREILAKANGASAGLFGFCHSGFVSRLVIPHHV